MSSIHSISSIYSQSISSLYDNANLYEQSDTIMSAFDTVTE